MNSIDHSRVNRYTPRHLLSIDNTPVILERSFSCQLIPPRQPLLRSTVVPLDLLRVPRWIRNEDEFNRFRSSSGRVRASRDLLRPRREDRGHVRNVGFSRWAAVTGLMRSGRDHDVSELRHVLAVERGLEEWIPVRKGVGQPRLEKVQKVT